MIESLTGVEQAAFDRDIRGRTWRLLRAQNADLIKLFDWDALNGVLDMSDTYVGKITVRKEGATVEPRLYTTPNAQGFPAISPAAIRRCLQEGYSLVLNELHTYHRATRRLCEALTEDLGESVGVNAYVSWKSDRCFTTHWDSHDALIIQTAGAKEWSVFKPTREFPMATDVAFDRDLEGLELCWRGVLHPGDVLYLPRGWWHHAKSTGAGSIHLTAGFRNRRVADLVSYLLAKASADPVFRADLARPGSLSSEASSHVVDDLAAFFSEQLTPALIDEFWNQAYGELPRRAANRLPALIDPETFHAGERLVRFAGLAPHTALETTDADFNFCLGERKWHLDLRAYNLVSRLLDGQAHTVSQLVREQPGGLTEEEVRALVYELTNEGVLVLA